MLEWRQCQEFPDYQISELGHIFNNKTQSNMRTRMNGQGVIMVGLRNPNGQFMRSVARLVAEAYVLPLQSGFNTVIHLNGDHEDCRAFNLQWRSRSFALHYHRMFNDLPLRVGIYIPATGERFHSLREACTTYGWVEKMAYRALTNREPVFPHGWILEPLRR